MSLERNLGIQPIADLLQQLQLKTHDLVAASDEQLTHKMVSRAVKGRRLTRNTQLKVLRALNMAANADFETAQLFNY